MKFTEFKAPDGIQLDENENKLITYMGQWVGENLKAFVADQKTAEDYAADISKKLAEQGVSKEALEKINNTLVEQGKVLAAMKDNGRGISTQSIADILREKSEELKAVKDRKSPMSFEIKAAGTMTTTGNITPQPNPYLPRPTIIDGVNRIVETSQVVTDYVSRGTISTPRVVWVNEVAGEGDAEFVAEGALKPLVDVDFKTEDESAKKVAAVVKVSEEMLDDISWMESEIRRLLTNKVTRKINESVLNGDGTNSTLNGIINRVGGYVQTCLNGTIDGPGMAEVLLAAATQIRGLGFTGRLTAFVNPCDYAGAKMRKDSNGNIIDLRGVLDGISVVETSEIPVGSFLIGDMTLFILEVYKALRIEIGWENDDFRRNLRTLIAEARVLLRISSNNIGGFVYDTYAAVQTLIAKA